MLFLRRRVSENWSFWLLWFWPPGDAWGRLVLGTSCPGLIDPFLAELFGLIQYSNGIPSDPEVSPRPPAAADLAFRPPPAAPALLGASWGPPGGPPGGS